MENTEAATFRKGDRVRVNDTHPFLEGTQGTLVETKDHPAGGKVAVFREVGGGLPDYHEVALEELSLDSDPDGLDLLEVDHVLAELRETVGSDSKYSSIVAEDIHDRIIALSRVCFLASRAQWLLASRHRSAERDAQAEARRAQR